MTRAIIGQQLSKNKVSILMLLEEQKPHCVAGGTNRIAKVDQGVPVAIKVDANHVDEIAGGIPFTPLLSP